MKQIGEKITFINDKEKLTVVVSTKVDKWKEISLFIWVFLWTICGVVFGYYFSQAEVQKEQLFYVIILSFWFYFEYRIGKALLWRLFGKELIKIDKEKFYFKKSILGYGKTVSYFIDNLKEPFEVVDYKVNNLVENLEDSFWTIGGGRIKLKTQTKTIDFGFQINELDSKLLARLLQASLNSRKSDIKRKEKSL
jgi:hypothetical protein